MGMFDYVRCEFPLPASAAMPPEDTYFQTKDTADQYLTTYTITAEGRLMWHPYTVETVPKAERPHPNDDGLLGLAGSQRRVEGDPEAIDFHGILNFYHFSDEGEWWSYDAKFTDGVCVGIQLVEHRPLRSLSPA